MLKFGRQFGINLMVKCFTPKEFGQEIHITIVHS
jgi:hypothetical protein